MHFTRGFVWRLAAVSVVIGAMYVARARLVWELAWPDTLTGLACVFVFYGALILGFWLWGRRSADSGNGTPPIAGS